MPSHFAQRPQAYKGCSVRPNWGRWAKSDRKKLPKANGLDVFWFFDWVQMDLTCSGRPSQEGQSVCEQGGGGRLCLEGALYLEESLGGINAAVRSVVREQEGILNQMFL